MNPFDYSLCRQTVTLYRKEEAGITRQVLDRCGMFLSGSTVTEAYGKSRSKKFLLIIPGNCPVLPGDRVFYGIGPDTVAWDSFIPAAVPELFEVAAAKPCFWEGQVSHWEAGAERSGL